MMMFYNKNSMELPQTETALTMSVKEDDISA